jgi:hypothetical protein
MEPVVCAQLIPPKNPKKKRTTTSLDSSVRITPPAKIL